MPAQNKGTSKVLRRLDGKTVNIDRIRMAIEQANRDYHGPDPDGFSRSADELVEGLKRQYGDQVPVAEAFQRFETLAQAPGVEISLSF